MIYMAPFQERL